MLHHRSHTKKSMGTWPILVLVCFTLGLIGPVGAGAAAVQCNTRPLGLPDPDTLNLPDGEHVIGQADTVHGRLEAHVIVKNKVASGPIFFIRGKQLQDTPASRVPKDILDCLYQKKSALPSESWYANAISSTLDWIESPAEAKAAKCTVLSSSCNQNTCCALVDCGGRRGVGCASY
jgi:hypothetical protein